MVKEHSREIEWPTVALIAAVYAVLGHLVCFHASLPWWVILPVGAYCTALHASLQHEVLHGHPTGNRLLNEAMVFVTPAMWLPYHRYKQTHLQHHNDVQPDGPGARPRILLPAAGGLGRGAGHPPRALPVQQHAGRAAC